MTCILAHVARRCLEGRSADIISTVNSVPPVEPPRTVWLRSVVAGRRNRRKYTVTVRHRKPCEKQAFHYVAVWFFSFSEKKVDLQQSQYFNVTIFSSIFFIFPFHHFHTVQHVQSTKQIKFFDMSRSFARDHPKHLIYKPVGLEQRRNPCCFAKHCASNRLHVYFCMCGDVSVDFCVISC